MVNTYLKRVFSKPCQLRKNKDLSFSFSDVASCDVKLQKDKIRMRYLNSNHNEVDQGKKNNSSKENKAENKATEIKTQTMRETIYT